MNYVQYIKKHVSISLPTIWRDITTKKDPTEFKPNGSQIYHGYQGEGKTASMVHATMKLKADYPLAILVSNLTLAGMTPLRARTAQELVDVAKSINPRQQYIYYETYEELIMLLRYCRNGRRGVIFNIDEIHNYFHSHDSKSMPMWVVQVFSQQRKQKILILGTVQDWDDVIKAIRRQIDNLVECHRVGYFIFQQAVDPRTAEMQYGERLFSIRKKGFFFLSEKIRNFYDTGLVINSGREILGGGDLHEAAGLKSKENKAMVKTNKKSVKSLKKAFR